MDFISAPEVVNKPKYRPVEYQDIQNGDVFTFKPRHSDDFHHFRNLMVDKDNNKYFDLKRTDGKGFVDDFSHKKDRDYAIVEGHFQETGLKTQIEIEETSPGSLSFKL